MDQHKRNALNEVIATLDGLTEYLNAIEARNGVEDPQFERVRKRLVETSQAIRWDIDNDREDQAGADFPQQLQN